MNSNVLFTIVTKNYIPMSNVLGDSILKNQPDTDFKVFIVDEFDTNKGTCISRHDIISIIDLTLPNLESMAFKYNLTEFCTAIKPKCFEYIFKLGYNKSIYLDPDIYVFSNLEPIFNDLENHSICLAPHILFPEVNYAGHWPLGRILAAGVYNLGFIGLRNSETSKSFLNWWGRKLEDSCYSERSEGLFTDQKWLNFCPVFFPDVYITRELGVDVALWNIHEREIIHRKEKYLVKKRINGNDNLISSPLIFIHFSNFNFSKCFDFNAFIPFSLDRYSDFIPLVDFYREKLLEYDFIQFNKTVRYTYNYYQNGVFINKIHRRLYRVLFENNVSFKNPFQVEINSFYCLLKKNRLIDITDKNMDNIFLRRNPTFSFKFSLLKFFSRILLMIIGIKRYTFLCRFSLWFSKYENHTFLIKDFEKKLEPKNLVNYINIEKE